MLQLFQNKLVVMVVLQFSQNVLVVMVVLRVLSLSGYAGFDGGVTVGSGCAACHGGVTVVWDVLLVMVMLHYSCIRM